MRYQHSQSDKPRSLSHASTPCVASTDLFTEDIFKDQMSTVGLWMSPGKGKEKILCIVGRGSWTHNDTFYVFSLRDQTTRRLPSLFVPSESDWMERIICWNGWVGGTESSCWWLTTVGVTGSWGAGLSCLPVLALSAFRAIAVSRHPELASRMLGHATRQPCRSGNSHSVCPVTTREQVAMPFLIIQCMALFGSGVRAGWFWWTYSPGSACIFFKNLEAILAHHDFL